VAPTQAQGPASWVGAVGERFVELAVDAEPFEGGGEPANGFGGQPSAGQAIIINRTALRAGLDPAAA